MPLPAVKPGKLKLKLNNVNKILNEAPVRKKIMYVLCTYLL